MLEGRWKNVANKIRVDIAGTILAQRLCTTKLMLELVGHSKSSIFEIAIVNLKSIMDRGPSIETGRTDSLEAQDTLTKAKSNSYVGYSRMKQRAKTGQ